MLIPNVAQQASPEWNLDGMSIADVPSLVTLRAGGPDPNAPEWHAAIWREGSGDLEILLG